MITTVITPPVCSFLSATSLKIQEIGYAICTHRSESAILEQQNNICNCKPFGAPADPASITPVRMKYAVFRTIDLAFSLRMRMDMEREREMEMEMEMEMVILGALKASWEVIFGAPKAS